MMKYSKRPCVQFMPKVLLQSCLPTAYRSWVLGVDATLLCARKCLQLYTNRHNPTITKSAQLQAPPFDPAKISCNDCPCVHATNWLAHKFLSRHRGYCFVFVTGLMHIASSTSGTTWAVQKDSTERKDVSAWQHANSASVLRKTVHVQHLLEL